MYRLFFSTVLTRIDPERAHHLAFMVIQRLPLIGIGALVRRFTRPDPSLAVSALGLTFDSPFGVAAGFDKDGKAIRGLGQLGFGHVEVGTITARPQPGNPRPRLFRLVADSAVINRMGFNNYGAAAARDRLAKEASRSSRPIIGVNIGKSRVVEVDDAVSDYLESTMLLAPAADYLVVNVSSPNTPGLRGLQELDKLAPLLSAVQGAAGNTPVLVKIAPDLSDGEVRRITELALELGLDGIIANNTTLSRENLATDPAIVTAAGAGGLSGAPLAARSLELLVLIRSLVPDDFCVISVGGVDTAADVRARLAAGATLVQGYTAFLYRGPFWARSINRGLAAHGA
ncbi:quinone-dependent dihydroorotate dehydrogenase [Conyzicola nivalis]|uniref:Dihydroorotate dehydrogenase (quinone) n=1 Tax=Conyzicola nivalis TaxID=1477021 RepID=A0A916WEZ5_9MICO|nr:quinone-dependent dihydroorotate dehydrogenase [Conyzicola nivalis]GGA94273.1 dihydroorotate dehydrogenase (quinone) [Conyzicola nivalis]